MVKKLSSMLVLALTTGVLSVGCTQNGNVKENTITSAQLLSNINSRKSIAMSIDREEFTKIILNDGSIGSSNFVPTNLAYNKDGNDYRDLVGDQGLDYDLEKAKEYWQKSKEELDFDNVTIEILTNDVEMNKRISEYIQNALESNLDGLTVKLKQVPQKQKSQLSSEGEYDLQICKWGADYPDPLTFLDTYTPEGVFANNTNYDNKIFNEELNKAKQCTDIDEAFSYYAKAEKALLDDAVCIPLYQESLAYLQREEISNLIYNNYGARTTYKWAKIKDKEILNVAVQTDIQALDSSKVEDTVAFDVINATMEGLVRVDENDKVVPGMAKDWSVSEDGLVWTFNLRKDQNWSNGAPVTANDFEFAIKRTLNPETASEYAFIMYDIKGAKEFNKSESTDASTVGVKALDDYTLEITLNKPINYFDKLVSFPVFFPQNEEFVTKMGESYGTSKDTTLYNGPFVLTKWKTEDQFTMEKNPNYWDKKEVNLSTINAKVVKDVQAGVSLFEAGEIDIVQINSEYVDKFKDSKDFKLFPNAATIFLTTNQDRK